MPPLFSDVATTERIDYRGRNHYDGDLNMLSHFLDVVEGKTEPASLVEDGYYAVATAVCADRSAQQETPVAVPCPRN